MGQLQPRSRLPQQPGGYAAPPVALGDARRLPMSAHRLSAQRLQAPPLDRESLRFSHLYLAPIRGYAGNACSGSAARLLLGDQDRSRLRPHRDQYGGDVHLLRYARLLGKVSAAAFAAALAIAQASGRTAATASGGRDRQAAPTCQRHGWWQPPAAGRWRRLDGCRRLLPTANLLRSR
jgi:hypothetical protein